MATITTKYNFGDLVYLITDEDQRERIVTGFDVRPCAVYYVLSCGTLNSVHLDFEIATTKDIKKATEV